MILSMFPSVVSSSIIVFWSIIACLAFMFLSSLVCATYLGISGSLEVIGSSLSLLPNTV